jgi:hypothetical protein
MGATTWGLPYQLNRGLANGRNRGQIGSPCRNDREGRSSRTSRTPGAFMRQPRNRIRQNAYLPSQVGSVMPEPVPSGHQSFIHNATPGRRIAAAAGPGHPAIARRQTAQPAQSLAVHPDQGGYQARAPLQLIWAAPSASAVRCSRPPSATPLGSTIRACVLPFPIATSRCRIRSAGR